MECADTFRNGVVCGSILLARQRAKREREERERQQREQLETMSTASRGSASKLRAGMCTGVMCVYSVCVWVYVFLCVCMRACVLRPGSVAENRL